jgi:hypothetical protein
MEYPWFYSSACLRRTCYPQRGSRGLPPQVKLESRHMTIILCWCDVKPYQDILFNSKFNTRGWGGKCQPSLKTSAYSFLCHNKSLIKTKNVTFTVKVKTWTFCISNSSRDIFCLFSNTKKWYRPQTRIIVIL